MAIKRLSRSAGLAVPTNIANPNNNINSSNSTISTTDNVLWLNSKQINKGIKIEYQNNGKVQTTTIQRPTPPTKKSFASLFHILAYTFTFIVMSLNIYVQYHSNQYNMHISRAKELLQRSKLGMGGSAAMDPTHRNLQAVDSEEVIKALEELTKAEEEEVTFTLPDSLAMNVADYIPNVPDAMELMNDINNYTNSLAADFIASDAEEDRQMATNLHEYVEWGKNNVHGLLSSAHDWIDTVKVNGLRGSSADVDTEKEDTASDINEDSGDDKDGAAWMDGLDEDEDDEEDIKLTDTIKRRSLPDVDTTQQQENNSVVSDENGVEDSSLANEAVVANPIKDTSIKEDTIKSSKEKSSTPSDIDKDEHIVDVKEVVKKILPSIATAEAKLDAKSPEGSTEHKPSKGLAATKTSLVKPRGVVKGEETHLNKQHAHHQDKKEKASITQKRAVSLAAALTSNQAVSSYTLENALQVFDVYNDSVAVVIYDPKDDKFNFLYTDDIKWKASHFKRIRTVMTNSLRRLHPERFNPKASEFVFVIASNDYPQYKFEENKCYHNHQDKSCVSNDFPPILHLGSVFKHPVVPSTITMPLPERNHLACFHQWLEHGSVCKLLKPKAKGNPQGIEFGNQEWKDLIPQVIWRGSDQSFLHRAIHGLRRPHFDTDIELKLTGKKNKKNIAATKALRAIYDHLLPRWKGVVLTSEAEHAQHNGGLPWANIKFTTAITHGKDGNKAFYNKFVEHGISAIGESMSHEELSKYKYHIDIGGSGGTAIDTLDKLAMPGLLFHHETQTKDYLHSIMKPMVHYVPIRGDLSDLQAKFEWAEKNPDKAQKIAKQASHLVKRLSTDAGFLKLSKELFEEPLSSVVAAYKPLKNGVSWKEFINKHKDGNKRTLRPRWKCGGLEQGDCLEVHGNLRHGSSKAKLGEKKTKVKSKEEATKAKKFNAQPQVVVDLV